MQRLEWCLDRVPIKKINWVSLKDSSFFSHIKKYFAFAWLICHIVWNKLLCTLHHFVLSITIWNNSYFQFSILQMRKQAQKTLLKIILGPKTSIGYHNPLVSFLVSFPDNRILHLFLKIGNLVIPKFCYLSQRWEIKNKVM